MQEQELGQVLAAVRVLLEGGTAEQKQAWLPGIASGEIVASFALTEADAGSSPADLRTSARRDGADGWVINGAKRYITNAPLADVFMVFARTQDTGRPADDIKVFLVGRDTPGLSVGPRDHKMGQFGAWTADVYLDDVRVAGSAIIGGESGSGYLTAMRSLSHGRVHIAALCVGMADRLIDESVAYARSRVQGGRPIATRQLIQAMIADSVTETMAARSLVLDVARRYDDGTDRRVGPAAAKYFASETVGRVADRAVQVHGGAGYMRESAVERFYRDARLFRICERHQPDPAADHRTADAGRMGRLSLSRSSRGACPARAAYPGGGASRCVSCRSRSAPCRESG